MALTIGASPPTSPSNLDEWQDLNEPPITRVYSSADDSWIIRAFEGTVNIHSYGATPHSSPSVGDTWTESTTSIVFMYVVVNAGGDETWLDITSISGTTAVLAANNGSDFDDIPATRSNLGTAPGKADIILQHRVASGVNGGSTTTGDQIRPINAVNRGAGLVTLASNKFKLLTLGDVGITGFSTTFRSLRTLVYLYNVTTSTLVITFATSYVDDGTSNSSTIHFNGDFEVTDITHEYAIYVDASVAQATNGWGVQQSSGKDSIFAEIRLKNL